MFLVDLKVRIDVDEITVVSVHFSGCQTSVAADANAVLQPVNRWMCLVTAVAAAVLPYKYAQKQKDH